MKCTLCSNDAKYELLNKEKKLLGYLCKSHSWTLGARYINGVKS